MTGEDDGSVALRPMSGEDHGVLYRLVQPFRQRWWRVYGMGNPDPHQFPAVVEYDTEMVYLVEHEGVVVGVGSIFELNRSASTAWLDLVVKPASIDQVRASALGLLVDQAFANWGLRKMYGAHHGFDDPFFAGLGVQSEVEGILPAAYWAYGQRWDRTISAVWRTSWVSAKGEGAR